MPDVEEGGRSVRLGCMRGDEMADRGGCVRCAGAGKSCVGGARAAGSAGGLCGAGVSVVGTSDSGAVRWWAAVGGGRGEGIWGICCDSGVCWHRLPPLILPFRPSLSRNGARTMPLTGTDQAGML